MIVERLKAESGSSLAYFYFSSTSNRSDGLESCRVLVASLLFQIACSSLACWRFLHQQERTKSSRCIHPSDDHLFNMLRDLLRISGPTFVVIDALDECRSCDRRADERRLLFKFLRDIYDLDVPGLHLLFTTRPEDDLFKHLDYFDPSLSRLVLHHDLRHTEDLRTYISTKLGEESFNWASDKEAKSKAEKVLNAKAQGM